MRSHIFTDHIMKFVRDKNVPVCNNVCSFSESYLKHSYSTNWLSSDVTAGVYVVACVRLRWSFVSDVTSRFEWGSDGTGYVILREYFVVMTVGGLTREYFTTVMLGGSSLVFCLCLDASASLHCVFTVSVMCQL